MLLAHENRMEVIKQQDNEKEKSPISGCLKGEKVLGMISELLAEVEGGEETAAYAPTTWTHSISFFTAL
jgi:hypothetical protein